MRISLFGRFVSTGGYHGPHAALADQAGANRAYAGEDMTFTGWVADEACAKDFSKAGTTSHAACASGCLNNDGAPALAMESGLHLLDSDAEAALEYAAMEVVITGTLDEATNTIKVTSIEAKE